MITSTSSQVKSSIAMPPVTLIEGSNHLTSSEIWSKHRRMGLRHMFHPKIGGYLEDPGIISCFSIAISPNTTLLSTRSPWRVSFMLGSCLIKWAVPSEKSVRSSFSYQCKQNRLQLDQSRGRIPLTSRCRFDVSIVEINQEEMSGV